MLRKSLKDITLEQVGFYLSEDNPVRETKASKFFGLFSGSGKDGRDRAIKFRDVFLEDAKYVADGGDFQLKNDLWAILCNTQGKAAFDLGSSEKLKIRLLNGMCEHLGISDLEVNHHQALIARSMATGHTGYINGAYVRIEALMGCLRQKLNASVVEMSDVAKQRAIV